MLGRQPLAFQCLLHFSFGAKVFWLRHLVGSPLPFSACCTLVFRAKMFWLRHLVGSPLPLEAKVWASLDKYAGLEREANLADLVFVLYIKRRSKFAA